jgi:hypothetical protein
MQENYKHDKKILFYCFFKQSNLLSIFFKEKFRFSFKTGHFGPCTTTTVLFSWLQRSSQTPRGDVAEDHHCARARKILCATTVFVKWAVCHEIGTALFDIDVVS